MDTPENLENKVSNNNMIYVTVEDKDNKIESVKEKVQGIEKIELIKNNETYKQIALSQLSEEELNLQKNQEIEGGNKHE